MTTPGRLAVTLLALAIAGCGGDEPAGSSPPGTGGDGGGGAGGEGGQPPNAGADLDCPPGQWQQEADVCVPPGIPADGCAAGFSSVDGGCEAIIPDEDCPAGTLAVPGDTACRPVGSCGSGTWGDIPVDGTTQHVDASFGGASDGSAAAPWKSIGAAIVAAAPGAVVAVAAGTYPESLVIHQPVRIWGVCAGQVALQGGAPAATVSADGTELHGLGITGSGVGLYVDNATGVVAADLWLHDLPAEGVYLVGHLTGASLHLDGSLVEHAVGFGVEAVQADLTITGTAIRDVLPQGNGNWGAAVLAFNGTGQPRRALAIEGSHLERLWDFGVVAQRTMTTTIDATLIRDVEPNTLDGTNGIGIWQRYRVEDGEQAELTVTGAVIERTHVTGIEISGGTATIDGTTVRDTAPDLSEDEWGAGVHFHDIEDEAGHPPTGVLRRSLVDGAHRVAVELWGAEAVVESVILRDPRPRTIGDHGFGVLAYDTNDHGGPSHLTLQGARIERAYQAGIIVAGSTATIDGAAVLDTQPTILSGAFGVGITVITNYETLAPASATIQQTVVDGAHAGGIVVGGGDLVVEDVIVRDVEQQLNVEDFGDGIGASSTIVWIPDILPTTLEATRITIENAARAGMSNFGATVAVADSFFDCNQIDLDGEPLDDLGFTFDDRGGNDCGCGDERSACKVLSTDIDPPFSF